MSSHSPASLKAYQHASELEIAWETSHRLPYRFLRGRCPCASCVNEFTGKRIFDIDQVSDIIQIQSLDPVGNYAVRIVWSDGHQTGLFTWVYLKELAGEFTHASGLHPST